MECYRPELNRHKSTFSPTRIKAHVDFSRTGMRQFTKINHVLGAGSVKGFILCRELEFYISAHEQAGVHLDTVCQEIRYDDNVSLIIMKSGGVWFITDIWVTGETLRFSPIYFWKRIKLGWREFAARSLIGWRRVPLTAEVCMNGMIAL